MLVSAEGSAGDIWRTSTGIGSGESSDFGLDLLAGGVRVVPEKNFMLNFQEIKRTG